MIWKTQREMASILTQTKENRLLKYVNGNQDEIKVEQMGYLGEYCRTERISSCWCTTRDITVNIPPIAALSLKIRQIIY